MGLFVLDAFACLHRISAQNFYECHRRYVPAFRSLLLDQLGYPQFNNPGHPSINH
jgi:hypothetical protein